MNIHMLRIILTAGAVIAAVSCSSVRQVRPLDPGENVLGLSAGGPMTNYVGDAYLPLPLLSLAYNRGLIKGLDLEAGFQLTHAVFGVTQFDIGANWHPWETRRFLPDLIISPRFQFVTNFKNGFLTYPTLNLTAAWKAGAGFTFHPYLGIENWFELQQEREDGNPQQHHWIIAPYLGLQACTPKRWQYSLEMRYYTPNLNHELGRAPSNFGFGDYGILGFFLTVSKGFGGKKQ